MPVSRTHHDPGCGYRIDDFRHMKACVEPKNWPIGPYQSSDNRLNRLKAVSKPAQGVPNTGVALFSTTAVLEESRPLQSAERSPVAMPLQSLDNCACGWVSKRPGNPHDLKAHLRSSKVHR